MKKSLSTLIEKSNTITRVLPYCETSVGKRFYGEFSYRISFKLCQSFPDNKQDTAQVHKDGYKEPLGRSGWYNHNYDPPYVRQVSYAIIEAWKAEHGKESVKARVENYVMNIFTRDEDTAEKFMAFAFDFVKEYNHKPFYVSEVKFFDGPDDLHPSKVVCKELPYGKYRYKAYIKTNKLPDEGDDHLYEYMMKQQDSGNLRFTPTAGHVITRKSGMKGWFSSSYIINVLDSKSLFALTMIGANYISKVEEYVREDELKSGQ